MNWSKTNSMKVWMSLLGYCKCVQHYWIQWNYRLTRACWRRHINSSRPGQNGRHLADDIFKCICLNKNVRIPIQISLKFVPMRPIDDKPALVLVMAWRWSGNKQLPKPMLTQFINTYMWHYGGVDELNKCTSQVGRWNTDKSSYGLSADFCYENVALKNIINVCTIHIEIIIKLMTIREFHPPFTSTYVRVS